MRELLLLLVADYVTVLLWWKAPDNQLLRRGKDQNKSGDGPSHNVVTSYPSCIMLFFTIRSLA